MPKDRVLIIEGAAKRLGMTVVVESFEEQGYHAPSVEDDMATIGFVCSPEQEVSCEM